MKNISIIGSTGSIGQNALQIIENNSDYNIYALSCNKNYKLLEKQIIKFNPEIVSVGTNEGYKYIKSKFNKLDIVLKKKGLKIIGSLDQTDILLNAVSGSVGLEATVEAIKKEKRIALANKETMVIAGSIIKKLLQEYKDAEIIPVDSEHSAIFQLLESKNKNEIKRLILTASGGPFREYTLESIKTVTYKEALKHPTWSMGKKISIDSATMVNKGLEVIEAHFLFDMPYDKIDVVVHPESIIHSMVEFNDNSILAQMGAHDMKIPINYAFTYPERIRNKSLEKLDFLKGNSLRFEKLNPVLDKGLNLAFEAGKIGNSMPIVYNASNEIAVDLFLSKKIGFLDIYKIIESSMQKHKTTAIDSIDSILNIDKEIRKSLLE